MKINPRCVKQIFIPSTIQNSFLDIPNGLGKKNMDLEMKLWSHFTFETFSHERVLVRRCDTFPLALDGLPLVLTALQ